LGTTVFGGGVGLILPGILCFLASTPVLAETVPLALPQVVAVSLQNNSELISFREEKGIREAGKVKAGQLPNPILELEGGTGALTGNSDESSYSLGLSQEFILAGKREKRITIADQELEVYRWQLANRERLLRVEVKTAFYDLLLAEERLALADRAIMLNRQLLEVTRERLEAGDIPELEMNLVKVELARSEATKIDVEMIRNQHQAKLSNFMGFPLEASPLIVGRFATEAPMVKSLAELKQLSLGQRPDLKVLEAEKNRGETELALARAEGVPNLTAGLAFKSDTTVTEISGLKGKDTAYSIGLKLSMPIPLFDRNQAGVEEAGARRSSLESRFSAAVKTADREVAAAHASLQNAEKILSLYRTGIITQFEENLQLTQEAYRLGEIGILAVIQEQKKFFEVNDGYLTALHSRQNALIKLETAVAIELVGGAQ